MNKLYELIGAVALSLSLGNYVEAAPVLDYNGAKSATTQESNNGRTILLPEDNFRGLESKVSGDEVVFASDDDPCWKIDLDLLFLQIHYESPACRK